MEETEAAAAVTVSRAPGAGVEGAERRATATATALKVVAAVDASEESLHALSWALDHVVRCHPDATLVVVHAQHAVAHVAYPVAAHAISYAPASAVESVRKAQEENSRRIVARALDICRERQVDATSAILEGDGDAKEAICQAVERMQAGLLVLGTRGLCQAVERMQAGLLVLGTRGLGRIKRAFLGSVSDYLIHHACCPVLVVRPAKAQAK